MIAFNDKPEIDDTDDISEIHREIEGFDHCIEIHFKAPFCEYNDDELENATVEEQNEYDRCQEVYEDFAVESEILLNVDGIFLETLCDWRDEQTLWYRYNLLDRSDHKLLTGAICNQWAAGDLNNFDDPDNFDDESSIETAKRIVAQHGDTIEEFTASEVFQAALIEAYDLWLRAKKGVTSYDGYNTR